MKPSTKRVISILVALLFFVAALIFYSTFIKKEFAAIQKLRGEVAAKNQLLAEQQNAASQIKSLLQQYEGVSQLQKTISLVLPQDEDFPNIFSQFNAIAINSGVAIQMINIEVAPIQPPANSLVYGYGVLKFNIKVSGSYEAFKSFIQALETNIRVMDIKEIKLESVGSPGQKSPSNIFTYNLVVEAYYQTAK